MKRCLCLLPVIMLHVAAAPPANGAFAQWNSPSGGTVDGVAMTLTGLTTGPELSVSPYDLTDVPFLASPGAGDQPALNYLCSDGWTVSFTEPLTDVKLYAIAWRGLDGGATSVQYAFDRPFSIISGFSGATAAGNTLSLPPTTFYDGILQFTGSFNSLSVATNASWENAQAMTLSAARVPEPGGALTTLAAITVLAAQHPPRRRRLTATRSSPPAGARRRVVERNPLTRDGRSTAR